MMKIHVRPEYQPEQVFNIEEVNEMLIEGKLEGEEWAWTPGLSGWIKLKAINGVILPKPPKFTGHNVEAGHRRGIQNITEKHIQKVYPRSPKKKSSIIYRLALITVFIVIISIPCVAIIGVDYDHPHWVARFVGMVLGLNSIPLLIFGLLRLFFGKKVNGIIVPGYLVPLIIVTILAWYENNVMQSQEISKRHVSTNANVTDPNLFISEDFDFGIIFPGSEPQKNEVDYMEGNAARYQSYREIGKEDFAIYSVTATKQEGVPKDINLEVVLTYTADLYFSLSGNQQYEKSKTFSSWNNYKVLYYDSEYNSYGTNIPKRTMLLLRVSDGVMLDVSVVATKRQIAETSLSDFVSTLVLLPQPYPFKSVRLGE